MFLSIPRWLTASSFMEEDMFVTVDFIKINMVINFFIACSTTFKMVVIIRHYKIIMTHYYMQSWIDSSNELK